MKLKSLLLTLSLTCVTPVLMAAQPTSTNGVVPAIQPNAATVAAAARYDQGKAIFHPVHAKQGMVATEQNLATQVGVDILRQGGNAVDAAVAVAYALAVVLPNAGNIGGGGFMLVYDAKTGKTTAVDFREVAPNKATRDMYLDDQGNVVGGKSMFTHFAVGVPGTVAGLELALKNWGSMPREKVISPAIILAERGFTISPTLGRMLETEKANLGKWESTKAIFFKDGELLKAGDTLVQKDLAESLRLIAKDGQKAFYEGMIADKIVAEMDKHGGLISKDDLKNYQAIEREPVKGTYRGYEIETMPAPSSGGIHLVQILNILERYPLSEYGLNSAKTIHYYAEAMKLAYADRSEFLGDPAFVKVPVSGLISKAYADEQAKTISANKVRPSTEIKPGKPQAYESDQTTHFSIIDKEGNAVVLTYTLNLNFGSGIVAEGTGILLNNEMDDFSAKPGVPNAFGLIGGDANAIAPQKRPLSSMTPTIVLKDGKPYILTGSPGGARIITTVLQSITNIIDFHLNPAEAILTPRVHHQWLPDEIRVEKGISPDTIALLEKQGYKVSEKATMGRVQIIQVGDDGYYGYSDTRNPDGATLGY